MVNINTLNMDLSNICEDARIDIMLNEHDMFMSKLSASNNDVLSESILMEVDMSGILEKIKAFFKKIKDVIVAFFSKLFNFIRNLIISGLEKLYDAILERQRKKLSESSISIDPINELFEQFNSDKVQKLRRMYQEALPKFKESSIVIRDIPWYDDLNKELDRIANDINDAVNNLSGLYAVMTDNAKDINKEFLCHEIHKDTRPKIYNFYAFSGSAYDGSTITRYIKQQGTLVEHGVIIKHDNIDKYTKQIERAVFEQTEWKNSIKSLFEDTKRWIERSEREVTNYVNKNKNSSEFTPEDLSKMRATNQGLISIIEDASKDIQNSQAFLFNQGLKIVKRIIQYGMLDH